jgi:beta-galactosidase/beta-glucuronidase
VGLSLSIGAGVPASDWKPAKGPLATRWAKDVKPETAHKEYPRPQMVRKAWMNLNGLWDLAIEPKDGAGPSTYPKQILVPFPVESALSGVMERVGASKRVWYKRSFETPARWGKSRVLLHFGAVDWETRVWVNGKEIGTHTGGYDPFTFDVTEALKPEGKQEIVVSVWDPTDEGNQPIGKQTNNPRGILYTPTTGIWQTVWLEPVPQASIESLKITPNIDGGVVKVLVTGKGGVKLEALDGDKVVSEAAGVCGKAIALDVPNAKLWSPDKPFLYGLRVTLLSSKGKKVDQVDSYFGMRKVSLGKDENGVTRIMLNNKPLFFTPRRPTRRCGTTSK